VKPLFWNLSALLDTVFTKKSKAEHSYKGTLKSCTFRNAVKNRRKFFVKKILLFILKSFTMK